MKIESIEQADSEIKERFRTWKDYAVIVGLDMYIHQMASRAFDGRKANPQFFSRLSYQIGEFSVSNNVSVTLLYKALQCLVIAKLATWEEPLFYPSIAGALERFDDLIKMDNEYKQICMNY